MVDSKENDEFISGKNNGKKINCDYCESEQMLLKQFIFSLRKNDFIVYIWLNLTKWVPWKWSLPNLPKYLIYPVINKYCNQSVINIDNNQNPPTG